MTDTPATAAEEALRRAAAVSPARAAATRRAAGEHAARAGAVDVAWTAVPSPVGPLLAAVTEAGLVTLAFEAGRRDMVLDGLARQVSPRVVEAPVSLTAVRGELESYFAGRLRAFTTPLDWCLVQGAFARRVLEATAAVPFGQTRTYAQIAEAVGSPRGFRATGRALGSNPLPIVVPCHRVLRTGGGLGGYTGGLDVKRHLLDLEGAARAGGRIPGLGW